MPKITRHVPQTVPAPRAAATPESTPVAAPGPAMAGDRLVTSAPAASPADAMRALSIRMAACLAFVPRTSSQAIAWQAQGEKLQAQANAAVADGALKALPLKERSTFLANVKRLEAFLEDAPRIIRFVSGD